MALDDKLKREMTSIVSLHNLTNGYEHFDYDRKTEVLDMFPKVAAKIREDIQRLDGELRGSGADIDKYGFMRGIFDNYIGEFKPDYDRNLDEIVKGIVEKLNSDLKEVKDAETPLEAISKIAYAFLPLVENRDPTQEEANGLLREELSSRYGTRFRNVKADNPKDYKGIFLSLQAREAVIQYLKEEKNKEGKVIGYKIDEEKLKNTIKDNPLFGSALYLAEKPRQQQKQYAQAA